MVVTRILDGGSADKSKQIFPGDIIQSVDGVVTLGWSLAKVPLVSRRLYTQHAY